MTPVSSQTNAASLWVNEIAECLYAGDSPSDVVGYDDLVEMVYVFPDDEPDWVDKSSMQSSVFHSDDAVRLKEDLRNEIAFHARDRTHLGLSLVCVGNPDEYGVRLMTFEPGWAAETTNVLRWMSTQNVQCEPKEFARFMGAPSIGSSISDTVLLDYRSKLAFCKKQIMDFVVSYTGETFALKQQPSGVIHLTAMKEKRYVVISTETLT